MIEEIEKDPLLNNFNSVLPAYIRKAMKYGRYRRINMNFNGRKEKQFELIIKKTWQ